MNLSVRLEKAIEALDQLLPGYWQKTLAQRAALDGHAAGSVIEATSSELQDMLLNADWKEYSHDAIVPGCTAFKAAISGRIGVVDLESLPDEAVVILDDRKGTGTVSAVVAGLLGPEVDFTVIILGEEQGKEVIFTFHPGEPVSPSKVTAEAGLHGKQVTVAEARGMGLTTAKII